MLTIARSASALAWGIALGFAAAAAQPRPGWADFDPAQGKVVLDDETFVVDFDEPDSLATLGLVGALDPRGVAVTQIPPSDWVSSPVLAIEGQGSLRMGRNVSTLFLGLDTVAPGLRGRQVNFTMWVQPNGILPVVTVHYTPRRLADATGEDFIHPLGVVRLHPTGRATSDGWREVSTGPVDFDLHAAVEARFIVIEDERQSEPFFSGRISNDDSEFFVDGLSVSDVGPRVVPDAACSLVNEATVCGDNGACAYGRCADARAVLDNPPPIGPVREQYLERLIARVEIMAGGRLTQAITPEFASALRSLTTETRVAQYWTTFTRAFDNLADGHVSPPEWRFRFPLATGMCLNQGLADLLPSPAPEALPLVFSRNTGHPAGGRLEEGDVLIAIDGIAPYDWLESADRYLSYPGDPAARTYITTEQIPRATLSTGAVLTFARCRGTDGAACEPAQVETFDIDWAALSAPLWQGVALPWTNGQPCDFRFRRDVNRSGGTNFRTDFVGFSNLEGGTIRSILLNSVLGEGRWETQAQRALTDLPDRVLLDERTGIGGRFEGVTIVTDPFWPTNQEPRVQLVPQLRPDLDDTRLATFFSCVEEPATFLCGNFQFLSLSDNDNPRRGTAADVRLAVVNAFDVSGNDYLSRTLKERPRGQTRIFAATPTYGAFGPVFSLSRLLQELGGGNLQIQDTLFLRDAGDQNFEYLTGIGVPPDEVVLQRQSDAVLGTDTLLEAAKAWLRGDQP